MSPSPSKKVYCPSCGTMVEVMVILAGGTEVPRCSNCGLPIQEVQAHEEKFQPLKMVVSAEDSPGVRKIITMVLTAKNLAEEVIACENGADFISTVSKLIRDNHTIDLAILDVQMPILSGIQAALTLREIEKKFNRPSLTPILFFTVKICDEKFKEIMRKCRPSGYVNKGTSPTPQDLAKRIHTVVRRLLSEM